MAEAKRLSLQRLRTLLLDPDHRASSVAERMVAPGGLHAALTPRASAAAAV